MVYAEKVIVTREYMKEHGLSLKQFADALGYTVSSVKHYFNRPAKSIVQDKFWKKVSLLIGIELEIDSKQNHKDGIILPKYIATTLNQHGKTIIGRKLVERYGQDKIIKHLKEEGIHCKLNKIGTGKDVTYILEIVNA